SIPFNIKVILDGEEEKGSKPLKGVVVQNKELLEADYLIIADGPAHRSGLPTIVYGCRGITTLSLTTYGPIVPQHSGHYGNYAPNPALDLSQLLAGMKDREGRVLIDGYYEGITIDEETEAILREVPDDDQQIKNQLQIGRTDLVGAFYQASLQYPSLNIRGLQSGWVGSNARTIVPNTATAEIDLRLVPESDGNRLKGLVKDYIVNQGYTVIEEEPTQEQRLQNNRLIKIGERGVTDSFRTDLNHPFGLHIKSMLESEFEQDVVRIRIMGGTVPIAAFINTLDIPAFILPMVNHDNNQHSPNENLKIGQLAYGISTYYRLLTEPFAE
ncbi:MAG: M20/M25/M40 family metallo-hydrolase, partial [Flavobacteriaceae bacterium]